MNNENSLRFSVDSLLLGEIGERLVTKNYIALAELVKNAYDADATEMTIKFVNPKGDVPDQKSEIKIIDNGNGMNFKQIQEFWMRIATPNKRINNITPRFGRKKTGSKGIGRFACSRLAENLILKSTGKRRSDGRFDQTTVVFNWDKYEPGTTLTEVPNKYNTKILEKADTRTTLTLTKLRESWTEKEFNVLRRQILGLSIVSPEKRDGFEEDPGFTVILDAPDFEKGIGKLSEQVMDAGWGRLKGSVSEEGIAKLKLKSMKVGEVEFVFSERFAEVPHVHFDIAIIQRVKEYCRDISTLALYSIDDIFRSWSGVKVFLDGFRVYPYGDPGDDWLGIDERQARRIGKVDSAFKRVCDNLLGVDESRALLNQPRNQNLVGKVFLTNEPERIFRVPINREGFIENDSSKQLKELLRKAIAWATIYYNHFLYLLKTEKMEKIAEEFEEITEIKERAVEEIPKVLDKALIVVNEAYKDYKDQVPSSRRSIPGKHFGKALEVIKESTSHMNRQITTLRTIASTGALMFVFSHEAHDVVNKLGTISNKLGLLIKYVQEEKRSELQELSDLMRETRDRFIAQMKMFSEVSSNLADMKKHKIALHRLSEEVISCYSGLIDRFSIKVENEIPGYLRTGLMFEAEVYSILLNLISNAVKVVIAGYGERVKLEAVKGDDEIVLRIYDDGIGLSKQSEDLVLKARVADPENRLYPALSKRLGMEDIISVGEGSGLGLNIVQEILRGYDKTIRFPDVQEPWKTCVEVTLPI